MKKKNQKPELPTINPLLAVLFQQNLATKKKKKKKKKNICPSRDSNSGLSIVSSMLYQPSHYSILKCIGIYKIFYDYFVCNIPAAILTLYNVFRC